MTPEEIDKLEAGRELDALVAEKVMGWRWVHHMDRTFIQSPEQVARYKLEYLLPIGSVRDITPAHAGLLKYSTSISAAWEIVTKLKIGLLPNTCDDNWGAFVVPLTPEGYSYGNTAPLAICRAALKAKL